VKVLIVSPFGFAINEQTRYSGIEQLAYAFSYELNRLGHEVGIIGHGDSKYPDGVTHYSYIPQEEDIFLRAEIQAFLKYQRFIYDYDVVHDFSHQHIASRYISNLPSLNIFWHAPALQQYIKAPYNIIALSQWASREFKRVYRQEALYQPSIALDVEKYRLSPRHRNNRFLTLGRMAEEKGNLNALLICSDVGKPLDIVGADSDADYKARIIENCDGKVIRFLGEVSDEKKVKLLQTNKALIYATTHPEVTNHKCQEAMLSGMPVIVSDVGAASEIVTHGVNGYLCRTVPDFVWALHNVDKLEPNKLYDETRDRWSIESIVGNYIPLYEEVSKGRRW